MTGSLLDWCGIRTQDHMLRQLSPAAGWLAAVRTRPYGILNKSTPTAGLFEITSQPASCMSIVWFWNCALALTFIHLLADIWWNREISIPATYMHSYIHMLFIHTYINTYIHTRIHTCLLLLIWMPWHRQAIFESKGDKSHTGIHTCLLLLIFMLSQGQAIFELKGDNLSSSAECRIRTRISSTLNAHWQTDWAIEGQGKHLNSTARPYDQWAFSPLDPTAVWHPHLALAIYMFVIVNFDALAQASDFRNKRRQVVFLCWMLQTISQWWSYLSSQHKGEIYIYACLQRTDVNVVPSIIEWGTIHFGGKGELVTVEGPIDGCSGKLSSPRQGAPFAITVCWFKIMFLHTRHGPLWRKSRPGGHGLASQSPDMNSIEHIWDQMAIHIRDMDNPPTTQQQVLLMQWWLFGMT